jgi:hypothetical protein
MKTSNAALLVLMALSTPIKTCPAADPNGKILQEFEIREQFGVSHPLQIIDFDVHGPIEPTAVHVTDEDGKPVAFQFIENASTIAVQTDLPAHQTRRWKLVSGAPPAEIDSGVSVKEFAQDGRTILQITNGLTGVRVPASASEPSTQWKPSLDLENYGRDVPRVFLPAPVQGVLYRDGSWSGVDPNGVVFLADRLVEMRTRLLESGPLKVVVEVSYTLEHPEYRYGATMLSPAGRGYYTSTITVLAGQPSVLFQEDTNLEMTWSMNLYPGLHPTTARYRGSHADRREYGYEPDGRPLQPSHERKGLDAQVDLQYDRPVLPSYVRTDNTWAPLALWDRWAANTGWYWQLFDSKARGEANLVGIFAGRASRALSAGRSGVSLYTLPAAMNAGARAAGFAIFSYRRGPEGRIYPRSRFQWGLFVGTKGDDLKAPSEVQSINIQMNLHGGINLNKVYRYALDFPDPPGGYGGLFMNRAAVDALKRELRQDQAGAHGKGVYGYLYNADPYSRPLIDLWADLGTQKLSEAVTVVNKTATDMLMTLVDGEGIQSTDVGYWQGGLAAMRDGIWIDQILADPRTSAEQRRQMKAAAALFAYVLWDNDFVPLDNDSGFNLGTANMPVQQSGYRSFYALLLAGDSVMAGRAAQVETATRRSVQNIINEYGAEMGSPHYVGASFMPILNILLQLKQLGREDPFKDEPRLARFGEFYMNFLTPPEPRLGGKRALISLGDSSTEPSEIFGVLGTGLRDAEPRLSARLMGAWRDNGKPHSSFFGTTLLMIDHSLPATDPALGDANFPGYYSVLRYGWGTSDESALWFVDGDYYRDHRHDDQGSLVLYALGKPLSIDWGSLYTPHVTGSYLHGGVVEEKEIGLPWDQDSPSLDSGGRWGESTQKGFASFAEGAYARASFRAGDTTWTRSVLSIHADPAHPVFVIRDDFAGGESQAQKVLTLNLMATGAVQTPAGPVRPPLRTHPPAEHKDSDSGELPSASPAFELSPGVNRLSFTGKYDVDWNVYTVSNQMQQALIGNWAVTPWGGAITDREERQHILRVRGRGPFTTVIVPWRRGNQPADLNVSAEGDTLVIKNADRTIRVEADSYRFDDGKQTVIRHIDATSH